MTFNQALTYSGSHEGLADMAGVTVTTVKRWAALNAIPEVRQAYIDKRTKGELKANGIKRWRK